MNIPDEHSVRDTAVPMTRKDMITLTGCAVASLAFAGCGSGSNKSSSPTSASQVSYVEQLRTEPTGAFSTQIDTFSQQVANLSDVWLVPSDDINAFQTAYNSTANNASAETRALTSHGRLSKQTITNNGAIYQIGYLASRAIAASYQMFLNGMLQLDSVGYVGDTVAAANSLRDASSTRNPEWVAMMMYRYYLGAKMTGTLLQFHQQSGINALIATIQSETDPVQQAVDYALLAATFNVWVDRVAASAGVAANTSWHLNTSISVSANYNTELSKVAAILTELPLGPGYTSSVSSQWNSARAFFSEVMIELVYQLPGTTASWLLSPDFTLPIRTDSILFQTASALGQSRQQGRQSMAQDQATTRQIVSAINTYDSGRQQCIDNINKYFNDVILSKLGVVDNSTKKSQISSLVQGLLTSDQKTDGDAALALTTANYLCGEMEVCNALNQVLTCIVDVLPAAHNLIDEMDSAWYGDPGTDVSYTLSIRGAGTFEEVEHDMIRSACLTTRSVDFGTSGSSVDFRTLTPTMARAVLAGAVPASQSNVTLPVPRSYNNVSASIGALIYDIGNRNQAILSPQATSGNLSFISGCDSLLLRRDSNSSSAHVPSITDANLFCVGVGLIPLKSSGVDLTKLGSFPTPSLLSELGTGVGVNVQ